MTEYFDLVDEDGAILGVAERDEVHGNPALLHPVVHCIIVNDAGELLLQLRSRDKTIQPGKWDTSVGGHVTSGEAIGAALFREIREEVGVEPAGFDVQFLYMYVMRNEIESELVHTYVMTCAGPFTPQASEVDELRFWTRPEIEAELGSGVFTPNFEDEFRRFTEYCSQMLCPQESGE